MKKSADFSFTNRVIITLCVIIPFLICVAVKASALATIITAVISVLVGYGICSFSDMIANTLIDAESEEKRQAQLHALRVKQFGSTEAARIRDKNKPKPKKTVRRAVVDDADSGFSDDFMSNTMAMTGTSYAMESIESTPNIKVGIDLCDATEPSNYSNVASPLCTVDYTDMYSGTAVSTDMFSSSNDTLSSMSDTSPTNDTWQSSSDY